MEKNGSELTRFKISHEKFNNNFEKNMLKARPVLDFHVKPADP